MVQPSEIKQHHELTQADYERQPLWTWWDSDEDQVRPLDCDGVYGEANESIWAACVFTLNDGSTIPGVVGLRASDQSPYLIQFWEADGSPLNCSLNPARKESFPVNALEALLERKIDAILPLTFETRCDFGVHPLKGQIPRSAAPQWLFPELKKWFDEHQ